MYIQYDYTALLQELMTDIVDPLISIKEDGYIQILRGETKFYDPIIDYYPEDMTGLENEQYFKDKNNLETVLVKDVIDEMKNMIKGVYVE